MCVGGWVCVCVCVCVILRVNYFENIYNVTDTVTTYFVDQSCNLVVVVDCLQ